MVELFFTARLWSAAFFGGFSAAVSFSAAADKYGGWGLLLLLLLLLLPIITTQRTDLRHVGAECEAQSVMTYNNYYCNYYYNDNYYYCNNYNCWFLQGVSTACYAQPCISCGRVVRPSVRLSQAGTVLKRRKLGSQNLHRWIAQALSLGDKKFMQKFHRVHP